MPVEILEPVQGVFLASRLLSWCFLSVSDRSFTLALQPILFSLSDLSKSAGFLFFLAAWPWIGRRTK
jgi:hypothetical protein